MLFRSDRKSTRLNSSHTIISYAVFCLKKKSNRYAPKPHPQRGNRHHTQRKIALTRAPRRGLLSPQLICARPCTCAISLFFFFNDTAPPEIYTLSLPDALPINDTATTEIYTLSLHESSDLGGRRIILFVDDEDPAPPGRGHCRHLLSHSDGRLIVEREEFVGGVKAERPVAAGGADEVGNERIARRGQQVRRSRRLSQRSALAKHDHLIAE